MDHEYVLHLREHRDRSKIFDGVERQSGAVKRRVGAMCPTRGCAEGIAVRWRLRDQLHANIAASSRPIFDDKGLSPPLIEFLRNNSGDRVHRTTRLEWNYNPSRSDRLPPPHVFTHLARTPPR